MAECRVRTARSLLTTAVLVERVVLLAAVIIAAERHVPAGLRASLPSCSGKTRTRGGGNKDSVRDDSTRTEEEAKTYKNLRVCIERVRFLFFFFFFFFQEEDEQQDDDDAAASAVDDDEERSGGDQ